MQYILMWIGAAGAGFLALCASSLASEREHRGRSESAGRTYVMAVAILILALLMAHWA